MFDQLSSENIFLSYTVEKREEEIFSCFLEGIDKREKKIVLFLEGTDKGDRLVYITLKN